MKNSTWDFIKTLTMVYVILTSFFSTSSSVYANAATQFLGNIPHNTQEQGGFKQVLICLAV